VRFQSFPITRTSNPFRQPSPCTTYPADFSVKTPQTARKYGVALSVLPAIEVEVMNIRNNVRDPEDRVIDERSEKQRKEKMMDKTVADSFPASDPPSSLPNPGNDSFNS